MNLPTTRAVSRYNISNGVQFASFPFNSQGHADAVAFRAKTPALKGRRIRGVIQCAPKSIPTGKLIDHT